MGGSTYSCDYYEQIKVQRPLNNTVLIARATQNESTRYHDCRMPVSVYISSHTGTMASSTLQNLAYIGMYLGAVELCG